MSEHASKPAAFDENNNEEKLRKKNTIYVERHLELGSGDEDFLIIPNGGSGDCMFKAVSQAVYEGDESKHREIRKRVVNFITSQRWEKFSESIEVQHINGNSLLQRQWAKDPKDAYKMYMTLAGTLGSSSELTAAGELFHYNFATIQEYCGSTQNTYRVENCVLFDESGTDFHYFYFTGDYDNGHWEYLKSVSEKRLSDGTYQGRNRIVINGEEISFEDWLRRETENNNDAEQLKIATNHDLYARRRTSHPFELKGFHFCRDGTVRLNGVSFTIAPVDRSDLFSVLAHECLKNEDQAHDIELVLMKHRYSYFEEINYKLITQPWSHNFTVDAIRYCAQSLKGNIQDLIGAADLYSFSFILYLKMSDDEDTLQCKFTHVDRWGGESDRTLYFFMRLSRTTLGQREQLIAKWWRLVPVDGSSPKASDAKLFSRKSVSREVCSANTLPPPRTGRSSATYVTGRPATADMTTRPTSRGNTSRPSTAYMSTFREDQAALFSTPQNDCQVIEVFEEQEPKVQVLEGGITVTRISDSELDETEIGLKEDHEKLFGPRPVSRKSSHDTKPGSLVNTAALLGNRGSTDSTRRDKIKPATGKDLIQHPDKVKTLVKISDPGNAGRALTYRGSGYIRADDVLTDLKSQGLIRMTNRGSSHGTTSRGKSITNVAFNWKHSVEDKEPESHFDDLMALRDENFNVLPNPNAKEDGIESDESDVSYENFEAKVDANEYREDKLKREISHHGQQFPPQELLPMAREYSKSRMNKVAPNPLESGYGTYQRGINRNHDYYAEDNDYNGNSISCLDRFCQFIENIFKAMRTKTRKAKKGLIRRYEGRSSTSPSMMNMAKRQKHFPRSGF